MEYKSKIQDKDTDNLFKTVLTLESLEECYRFFEDVCTIKEIKTMAQRLEVAKLLLQKHTYNEIEKATGASTATISRVNRTLLYGADGYQLVLRATEAEPVQNEAKKEKKKANKSK